MTNSVRVIPIECKFGPTSAYAYYIDAPEPALIDTGIASSASQEIETVLAEHGIRIEDIRWILINSWPCGPSRWCLRSMGENRRTRKSSDS